MTLTIKEGAKAPLTGYVSKLTGNNKYFRQMLDRADAYLPIVERIFQEEGLPDDFKYLVIQESSLVSNQVSSSNAVGYWQFKRETATEMGLRVDDEIDERMNIVSASRSAARYILRHNNYMQNWAYSLLAYYAGLSGAKALIDPSKIGSKNLDIDENTHWYILKFVAHKIAFEPNLYRPLAQPNLRIQEYTDCKNKTIEQLAAETNLPAEQLAFFNKWALKGFVPGDKDYTLILPIQAEDGVMSDQPAYVKAGPPVEKLEPWREKILFGLIEKPVTQPNPVVLANGQVEIPVFFDWNGIKAIQAKPGDNSAKLALLAGISRDEFLEYNDLRIFDPIVPGEVYYADNKKKRSKIPFHTVQQGQGLWEISQKYGIQMKALLAKNHMSKPEKLKPGRVLWLRHTRPADEPVKYEPVPDVPKLQPQLAKVDLSKNQAKPSSQPVLAKVDLKQVELNARHVIGNDTLADIEPTGMSMDEKTVSIEIGIEEAIQKKEPVVLASADPDAAKSMAVKKTEVSRSPAPEPVKPTFQTPVMGEIEVAAGMTWYQISRFYKKPLDSLFTWNGGQNRQLTVGQKIRVEAPVASLGNKERGFITETNAVSTSTQYHTVQPGESAFGIAKKYGMKVDRLLELNNREDAALRIGEKLKITP